MDRAVASGEGEGAAGRRKCGEGVGVENCSREKLIVKKGKHRREKQFKVRRFAFQQVMEGYKIIKIQSLFHFAVQY